MKRLLFIGLLLAGFLGSNLAWAQTVDDTGEDPTLVAIPKGAERRISDIVESISSVTTSITEIAGSSSDVANSASDLANDINKLEQGNSGIKITETDTELKIQVLGDILFDFNKATLRASAQETLEKLAEFLNHRNVMTIRVEGHTDSIGTDSYNQKLSEQWAETVQSWLVDNLENEAEITSIWHGARQPIATNKLRN